MGVLTPRVRAGLIAAAAYVRVRRGWWASAAVGLIAAFVALLVTDLITDDLEISGVGTWVLATVIVWIAGLLADLLLGRWLYRRIAGDERT